MCARLVTYSSLAAFYVNICMTMTAVSIMITVAILNIHHRSADVAFPPVVRVIVIGKHCRKFCI